tara:strand:+ start:1206 stop:1409 length:204 start_codon:yes stop_codon:yes gene_type:complete
MTNEKIDPEVEEIHKEYKQNMSNINALFEFKTKINNIFFDNKLYKELDLLDEEFDKLKAAILPHLKK